MSVLRYVQRTGEPLVVADATGDDRFARDPYFTDRTAARCWPCPSSAAASLRAVLLLENRLLRGAFTADRLDAVQLIAGQLAVSLDNAQLYAELTASRARIVAAADHARRRIERDLHDGAQQRLVSLALRCARRRRRYRPSSGELAAQLDALVDRGDQRAGRAARARPRHPPGGCWPRAGWLRRWTPSPAAAPVPVELDVAVEGRLPEQVEIAAYYAVSEALTNTAKHAAASGPDPGRHRPGRRHRHAADAGPRRRTRRRRPGRRHRPASASKTASRRSAAGSFSTARPTPAPPCASSSRSPPPAASRRPSRRPGTPPARRPGWPPPAPPAPSASATWHWYAGGSPAFGDSGADNGGWLGAHTHDRRIMTPVRCRVQQSGVPAQTPPRLPGFDS